jgi:hypothetical protein
MRTPPYSSEASDKSRADTAAAARGDDYPIAASLIAWLQ